MRQWRARNRNQVTAQARRFRDSRAAAARCAGSGCLLDYHCCHSRDRGSRCRGRNHDICDGGGLLGPAAMPEHPMSWWMPLWSSLHQFVEQHGAVVGVLVITLIFLSAWLEAYVLKQRTLAGATFFWGLTVLSLWVADPFTKLRNFAAAIVFVIGLTLLVILSKPSSRSNQHG
jgi:hypothetical protein